MNGGEGQTHICFLTVWPALYFLQVAGAHESQLPWTNTARSHHQQAAYQSLLTGFPLNRSQPTAGDRTFFLSDAAARLYSPAAYYAAKARALPGILP
jgi:hypothetical protein